MKFIGRLFLISYIFMSSFICMPSVFAAGTTLPTTPSSTSSVNLPNSVTVTQPSNLPSQFTDINKLYNFIFNTISGIAGAVFIVMLLIGGFQYLTAQGSDEVATKSKKLIINAIIGIIIVAVAWALGSFILKSIHLI